MRIRPATEDDAAAVTALWTEAYTGRDPDEGRTAPYEEWEFVDSMARARVFVAESMGSLAGVVAFVAPGAATRVIAAEGEAELTRLAVAGSARRQGVGRALAELCAERARATGATALVLWSRPYQVEAHRLYRSLGFRRAPERDSDDNEGRRLVFSLDLGDSTVEARQL